MKQKIRSICNTFYNIANRAMLKGYGAHVDTICSYGLIYIRNHGYMSIGENMKINSSLSANPVGGPGRCVFIAYPNAELIFGNNCAVSNSVFIATKRIIVGDNVMIGTQCKILDSDFHPIDSFQRKNKIKEEISAESIEIGDDVFVGMNSIILKGVTIGEGCVIGAGSVVSKSTGPGEIWAGNPARFIRRVKE